MECRYKQLKLNKMPLKEKRNLLFCIYQGSETSFGFSTDFWISSRSWSSVLSFISIPSFSAVSCNLVFFKVMGSLKDFSNSLRFFSDSVWAFLNYPMELPMDLANSGSLFAPKRSIITPKITISSVDPIID